MIRKRKDCYEIAQSFEENPWTDQNSTEASVDLKI